MSCIEALKEREGVKAKAPPPDGVSDKVGEGGGRVPSKTRRHPTAIRLESLMLNDRTQISKNGPHPKCKPLSTNFAHNNPLSPRKMCKWWWK